MYSLLESIGTMSRKQRLCWFVILVSTVLVSCGVLTGSEWVTIVTLTYAAFSAANVVDKTYGGDG